MTKTHLKIATRESPLAMWQAKHIRSQLQSLYPHMQIELLGMTTQGDRWLDGPLVDHGGKALFVKELEHALLSGEADIAVHSMKDVPMALPDGLEIAVITEREDPSDAFVSNHFETIHDLPEGAILGTSSLRRESQLRHAFPHIQIKSVRGNVNTRLAKLDSGEFDALILASSGLKRLEMQSRIRHSLDSELSLPAAGQGALGIEIRSDDEQTRQLLAPLKSSQGEQCVRAERKVNQLLEGGCSVPLAAFAEFVELEGKPSMLLRARVGEKTGEQLLSAAATGSDGMKLAERVTAELIEHGAQQILAKYRGKAKQ